MVFDKIVEFVLKSVVCFDGGVRMRCFLFFMIFSIKTVFASFEGSSSTFEILQGKLTPGNARYKTFAKALDLMHERRSKIIVETGTTRGINLADIFAGDGGSTLLFSQWAYQNKAVVYSVDIQPQAFENAAPFLASYSSCLRTVCGDSLDFLSHFHETIDLLYLDSYDFDANNPSPSQEHHLNEITVAYPLLTENSIVMIDDCNLPHGGKGLLAIRFLQERGWKIVLQDYQVILVKN